MARIQFEGNKTDAKAGGDGGSKFQVARRGFYKLQITDATNGLRTTDQAKNPNTPKTRFTLEIAEGEHIGAKVWHTVVWIPRGKDEKPAPGHGMALHWLHACNMPYDGKFAFDEQDFLKEGHCEINALLEVEDYEVVKDGRKYVNQKNVIRQVYTTDHPQPEQVPPLQKNKNGKASAGQTPGKSGQSAAVAGNTGDVDPDLGW